MEKRRLVITDTSALAHRKAVVLTFRENFIPSRRVVIPRSVCRESGRLRMSPYQDKRTIGHETALAIIELHSLPGIKVTMDSREPQAAKVDDDLLILAETIGGQLLTADGGLRDRAREKGIDVIDFLELCRRLQLLASEIQDIFPASQNPLKQGDVVTVRIVKLGEKPGQGVGYLDDGRMIIVEGGAVMLGGELTATVKTILPTAPGTELIFAVPVAETPPARRSE